MLGTNETASVFSSHNTDRVLITTYMLSGICAALGLIMLANYNSARADYGTVYITMRSQVVLGGTNPMGAKGGSAALFLQLCSADDFSRS